MVSKEGFYDEEGFWIYILNCLVCHEEFTAKRRDAAFHNATCRKRAERMRKRAATLGNSVERSLRHLEEMLQDFPFLEPEVIRQVRRSYRAGAATLAKLKGMEQVDLRWWKIMGEDGQYKLEDFGQDSGSES